MIPKTGPLKFSDISSEFNGNSPHSMSRYVRGGSLVSLTKPGANINVKPTTSAMSFSDYRGAVRERPLETFQRITQSNLENINMYVYPIFSDNGVLCVTEGSGGGGSHSAIISRDNGVTWTGSSANSFYLYGSPSSFGSMGNSYALVGCRGDNSYQPRIKISTDFATWSDTYIADPSLGLGPGTTAYTHVFCDIETNISYALMENASSIYAFSSNNGVDWVKLNTTGLVKATYGSIIRSIKKINGNYVAMGSYGQYLVSTNFVNWAMRNINNPPDTSSDNFQKNDVVSILYKDGTYYMYVGHPTLRTDLRVYTSSNLINWTLRSSNLSTHIHSANWTVPVIYYENGTFFMMTTPQNAAELWFAWSYDGLTWYSRNLWLETLINHGTAMNADNGSIAYANNRIVFCGRKLGVIYYLDL